MLLRAACLGAALAVLAASSAVQAQVPAAASPPPRATRVLSTAQDIFDEVHRRYASTRFRSVSFVQRTTHEDGRVEWWYEAESIPGLARVDVYPFDARNTSLFRNDSAYIWREGVLTARPGPLAATMWTLMDMYAVPPSETMAALTRRGFDMSRVHQGSHNGRPIHVIGALSGDTLSKQLWLDSEHLYAVKMIIPLPNARIVQDFSGHIYQDGGWIEQVIRVSRDGKLTLLEEYTQTKTNVSFPRDFFDPSVYTPPHWQVTHR